MNDKPTFHFINSDHWQVTLTPPHESVTLSGPVNNGDGTWTYTMTGPVDKLPCEFCGGTLTLHNKCSTKCENCGTISVHWSAIGKMEKSCERG